MPKTALLRRSRTVSCNYLQPARVIPSLLDDAREGLLQPPRSLPPKYFYDARGSRLFDRICDTPEYYPTRVESRLLQRYAAAVIEATLPDSIVELGSGTSRKTRFLFDACEASAVKPDYWPMDVCEPMLLETGNALQQDYRWLSVNPLVGDYHGGLAHLPRPRGRALFAFLGGTIGNFEHDEAVQLLADVAVMMRPDDYMLLGFDLVKDHDVLRMAYNDAAGITAEFNLNLLRVLNRELRADFRSGDFRHQAIFNVDASRIEMYLVSQADQRVRVGRLRTTIDIIAGERILTEISRKFTPQSITTLLHESGLETVEGWQPDNGYYSLVLARRTSLTM